MNPRLLDHPLDSKSLRPLDMPGVYIFIAPKGELTEKAILSERNIVAALKQYGDVLYVGKAKQLNVRLQNYRRGGNGSAGEWYKASKLNEEAQCVLVVPTPTHFEACLLELFLIRTLEPRLNYTSTVAGRIHFLLQDRQSRRLSLSTRKKSGMKVWGIVRARSQVRLAFDALAEGFEHFQSANGEITVQPFYSRFGRTNSGGRTILDVASKDHELCTAFLRGRRNGIMQALWKSMKKAADNQQFHLAAQMRDRYIALQELQAQLLRSRKLVRMFRNSIFCLPASDAISERRYLIERFAVVKLEEKLKAGEHEPWHFFGRIAKEAIELFLMDSPGQNETERLRVNFEFLRLMLWWHVNQTEPCSILQ
ncbi:MAG: hypothetical protein RI953_1595 [Pseudomonadota bacterium]